MLFLLMSLYKIMTWNNFVLYILDKLLLLIFYRLLLLLLLLSISYLWLITHHRLIHFLLFHILEIY